MRGSMKTDAKEWDKDGQQGGMKTDPRGRMKAETRKGVEPDTT